MFWSCSLKKDVTKSTEEQINKLKYHKLNASLPRLQIFMLSQNREMR